MLGLSFNIIIRLSIFVVETTLVYNSAISCHDVLVFVNDGVIRTAVSLQLVLASHLLDNSLEVLGQDVGLALELVKLRGRKAALLDEAVQAGRLLGDEALVLGQLVKDTDVVLCVLVRCALGKLAGNTLGFLGQHGKLGAIDGKLLSDLAKRFDGASSGVETTTYNTVGS